jgi:predicted NAD/FAD-dependent oxidoreductase
MSAVTRALARNLDITTGTRIHRFTQDEQQACWLIADDETRFGSFDCVLCSAPPAQTRALLVASEQAAVLHNPILQAAELLPCWAVAVAFDTPLELPYQGLQTKHPVLLWLTNNSSKPGRDNEREWWVLNASPDWSRDHKDAQPAAVQAALLNAFNDLTGCAWAEPGEVVTHRWLYARYQPQHSPGYLWFAEQRFGVIGDWLQGGRVEGAFNSASRWVNDWLAGNLDGPH